MLRLDVPLDVAAIAAAQDRIAAWLAQAGAPARTAYRVRLVIEELLANLVMHGRFEGMPPPARVSVSAAPGGVVVLIEDAAAPFDPRSATPPPAPTLDNDRLGGMGLALVQRMAAIEGYERTAAGWNRTKLLVTEA